VSVIVTNSAVIARLDRAIQYAAASRSLSGASGILDPRLRGDDSRERWIDEKVTCST